jgi:DNA-binding CsgD family transcriptional regulator
MTGNAYNRHLHVVPDVADQNCGLTARERQVLELVAAGLRDDDMAERLRIARSTVATLLRSSMAKLDAHTRIEAVTKLAVIEDERASSAD